MPDAASSAKVCIVCRKDCSSRPRTKDAQGRYTCRECFDRLAAKKQAAPARAAVAVAAAPPPLPAEDDGVPDTFWDSLPAQPAGGTSPCPNCSAPLPADAVICLSCGLNRQSGRGSRIKVAKAKRERGGSGVGISISPNLVAAVLLVAFGGGFFLAIGSEGAAIAYYAAAALLSLVAWILTIVTAFMDKRIGWGIASIFAWVPFVGLAVLYYAICLSGRPYVKVLTAVAIIVGLLGAIALRVAGVDLANFGSQP